MAVSYKLALASASPRRLDLLRQIGVIPDSVAPANIDETPRAGELPRQHALRLAREKACAAAADGQTLILAADTVVGVGRRILPKTETEPEARSCLELLSGRSHRVFTAVALKGPDGAVASRLVEARLRFKRLSAAEIDIYLRYGEWRGKAGGYAVQGRAGAFVLELQGSYSAVVGLPLYETAALLEGAGYPVWTRPSL
jgi:septum formation protein